MVTRQAMAAVALLIAAASVAAQPAPTSKPEATTAPATLPKPAAKPTPVAAQPTPSVEPVVAKPVSAASSEVALSVPLPRAKPKPPASWPPSPRLKPEPQVSVAGASPATALVAPAAATPSPAVAVTGEEALAACGNACAEILFKTVDDCLWVQSQNPRPIAFEAQVGGRTVVVKLEGANPSKADAYAAALKGSPAKTETIAYHTRLHDPFLSVSPGIPAYRVRLGPSSACVKSRSEIQRFTANFVP